jgi:hypothetical protein
VAGSESGAGEAVRLAGRAISGLVLLLVGCAGGKGAWTDVDTRRATAITRSEENSLTLCAPSDAGTCRADQQRALAELALCKAGAMLFAHGQPLGFDAGECPK